MLAMNQAETDKLSPLLEKVADAAAERAVTRTLTAFGLNTADPISVQGQFAFLRNLQYAARKARDVAITAAGGLIVTGICWAVWASVKAPAGATAVQLVH